MKKKVIRLLSILLVTIILAPAVLAGVLPVVSSARELVSPCPMESELDIYAGAGYYANLRNPVVKGDSYKVVALEWNINRSRKDYREAFSYSSQQLTFAESSTYYLRLTLHSLNYPKTAFSDSTNAADFSGFTVSMKVNGEQVVLSPHAVDNYDDTHEYIDLIYQVNTDKPAERIPVTKVEIYPDAILIGRSIYLSDFVSVQPLNATNQYIEWSVYDDGGTNYYLTRGERYLLLEPMKGYEPKPGTIQLVAQVQNGKADGKHFGVMLKLRVVSDLSLQGSVILPADPVVGKETQMVRSGDVEDTWNLTVTWEYKNSLGQFESVKKVKKYGSISDDKLTPGVGLIGKEIRVKISSPIYQGAVVSESKIVRKNSVMASPCGFTCRFVSGPGVCAVINSDTHLLQEFVLMKSSAAPTEAQWSTLAKYPTDMGDLSFYSDENGDAITGDTTYTIYSRFRATDTESAGSEIVSASYYTGYKSSMEYDSIKLLYAKAAYENNDTIILDLMGQSSVTFKPTLVVGPSNANVWRKHIWKLSGSAAVDFSGVGNSGGPYVTTVSSQNGGSEYSSELKAVFTKQGTYYLSADVDGSSDRYGYYKIIVIDSTKHIDEYVVSIKPSNVTPSSITLEQNEVLIPSFTSLVSIFPTAAQRDYKIVYKEASYKSGSYGNPYQIADQDYFDVDENTGAIKGKNVGNTGYIALCIYDTTTGKTSIVSGAKVVVTAPTHTHYLTQVSAKPATCTEIGYSKTFYVCGCGSWFADASGNTLISDHSSCILDELGHDYGEFIPEISATHDSDGTLGHYHCKRCGQDFDISKKKLESIVIGHSDHATDSTAWVYDSENHWHACVLKSCDEKLDQAAHTANASGDRCVICNAPIEKPTEAPSKETAEGSDAETDNETAEDTSSTGRPDEESGETETEETETSKEGSREATGDAPGEGGEGGQKTFVVFIIVGAVILLAIAGAVVLITKKKKS